MHSSFRINILIIFAFVIMLPLLPFLSVFPFNHLTIEFSSSPLFNPVVFVSLHHSLPIWKYCYINEWVWRRRWRERRGVGDDVQLGLDRGEGRGQPSWGKWEGGGFHSCYGNEIFVLGCQGNFRRTLDTAAVTTAPPHPQHTIHMTAERVLHTSHTQTRTPKHVRGYSNSQWMGYWIFLTVLWAPFTSTSEGWTRFKTCDKHCKTCGMFWVAGLFFLHVLCNVNQKS